MGSSSQIAAAASATPFSTSPYIVKIQEKYNVQVMFRTRPKLHATLVVVKGCEWEVSKVKEATVLLIHHMCENLAVSVIPISFRIFTLICGDPNVVVY
jgi:protein bicaudal C